MVNDPRIKIKRWASVSNEPLSEIALVKLLERQGYRCTRYVYPAGTTFPDHSHDVDKIDAVLTGQFKVSIYGESVTLAAGDYIYIPAKTTHSAEVTGNEPVVSIDAVKIT